MTYSNEPIEIDGKIFQPLLHLLYVEEPDFGCEGVPEDGAVCGSIVAEDAAGRRTMPIEEQTLFASRLDNDTWIGMTDGVLMLLDAKKHLSPLNEAEQMIAKARLLVAQSGLLVMQMLVFRASVRKCPRPPQYTKRFAADTHSAAVPR